MKIRFDYLKRMQVAEELGYLKIYCNSGSLIYINVHIVALFAFIFTLKIDIPWECSHRIIKYERLIGQYEGLIGSYIIL